MNDTPDWIPSHVEITVHQARELLLKNKNANSELYVSIQVDKEKFNTSFIPRVSAPQWNFVTEIPLMSLDTTINLTVKQRGKIGEQFIGYISIPLRNFSISPKLITHWYKLGSRPGKVKNKLRGDLQVSIKFLSNWSSARGGVGNPRLEEIERGLGGEFGVRSSSLSNGINRGSPGSRRMLARSKSDMKIKVRDVMGTSLLDGKPASPKVKDRLATAIRRSFRKKNRVPVFQECDDDFTFTHTPPEIRKRSSTMGGNLIKGAHSDSDSWTNSDLSQSPATVHPSIQVQSSSARESESSGDNQEEGGASEMNGVSLRERKRDWARGSKRRWTMNTLPLLPLATPTSGGSSTHTPSFSPSPSPSYILSDGGRLPSEQHGATPPNNDEENDETENTVSTYRAKTNISPHPLRRGYDRQRSYSVTSSQSSLRSAVLVEPESASESKGAEATTSSTQSTTSPSRQVAKDQTSKATGNSSNNTSSSSVGVGVARQTSAGEVGVSKADDGKSSEHDKIVSPTSSKSESASRSSVSGKGSSTGPKKSRPLTRRNTLAAVMSGRSRGSHVTNKTRTSEGNGSGTGDPSKSTPRKKALSPPATPNRKLLPATPVRRSEKAHLAATSRPKSMVMNGTGSSTAAGNKSKDEENNLSTKSTTEVSTISNHDAPEREKSVSAPASRPDSKNEQASSELEEGKSESETQLSIAELNATTPTDTSSAVDRKSRHTVAYRDSSPLYKDGFQPVSLLPPSMGDYQSQTLPSRGKLARRRTMDTLASKADGDHTLQRASSTHRINRSPQNTMLVHRDSMNYVTSDGGRVKSRPSSITPMTPVTPFDEVDGIGELTTPEVCSKSSVTSFSSTSTSSRPSTPSTPKYGARTPGEIVASALRNRTRPPSGVLRKAIGMYQENRRQAQRVRKSLQENRPRSCFIEELEEIETEEKALLEVEEGKERSSTSAGNSPQLRRNRSAAETLTGLLKNPFSTLRRAKSNASSNSETPSPSSRPVSMYEEGGDLGISADILERLRSSRFSQTRTSLDLGETSSPLNAEQKTSAPALMAYRCKVAASGGVKGQTEASGTREQQSVKAKEGRSEPIIMVRPPSMVESGSVKTLTELDVALRENASSPNPAGASPPLVGGGHGHSRHTTCSSVDSEGFVSVTSEEMTLEELSHQDLSQWSKEDLFRELMASKQSLKRKDQELKDIKNYLDNLLLRVMEHDPTILSSSK